MPRRYAVNEPDSEAFRAAARDAGPSASPVDRGAAYADYLAERGHDGAADYWYRRSGVKHPSYDALAATANPQRPYPLAHHQISPALLEFLPRHVELFNDLHSQAYARLHEADESRGLMYDRSLSPEEQEFHRRRANWRWVIDSTHNILTGHDFSAMSRLHRQLHELGHPYLTELDPEHFGPLLRAYDIGATAGVHQGLGEGPMIGFRQDAQWEGIPQQHASDALWMIHSRPDLADDHAARSHSTRYYPPEGPHNRYSRRRPIW